jgi:HEAT repeat protein
VRAAALRAMGRAGTDEDARILLGILRAGRQTSRVLEGAAVGLASLEKIRDRELRAELRAFFERLLAGGVRLPERARQLGILAVSLRARDDHALARSLGVRCGRSVHDAGEAAALLLSCGLARDDLLASEIVGAAVKGRFGSQSLHDVARSHAVLGLALTGKPSAVRSLAGVLLEGEAGIHTERSAVIGLGLLLRAPLGDEKLEGLAQRALLHVLDRTRDPLARGFAAVGMGTAHSPFGIAQLTKAVDKTGPAVVRPFAALALGLAVRRLPAKEAERVRRFLVRELEKTRHVHLAGALAIAVGVSGAREGRDLLLARAREKQAFDGIRANALEALGHLGDGDPAVMEVLEKALAGKSPLVVQNAAIALGFLGNRETASLLVRKLAEAPWEAVQIHMVIGLSHLGGTVAIEPLLELLKTPSTRPTVLASAATVVGILLDPRERDPLFEIDACCNPYALTPATRELVRLY